VGDLRDEESRGDRETLLQHGRRNHLEPNHHSRWLVYKLYQLAAIGADYEDQVQGKGSNN